MGKLLIDEYPVVVSPTLAKLIGINDAIVLQQIHYWLRVAEQRGKEDHYDNERWWTYNTYDDWAEQLPWLHAGSIRRIIKRLEEKGFLIINRKERSSFDNTNWYTIDYAVLDDFLYGPRKLRVSTRTKGAVLNKNTETTSDTIVEEKIPTPEELGFHAQEHKEREHLTAEERKVRVLRAMTSSQRDGVDLAYYPEEVVSAISEVCGLWGLVPPAKKTGDYALWIKSARDLRDACGDQGIKRVLRAVHSEWLEHMDADSTPPYHVSGPHSLVKVARAMAGRLRSAPTKRSTLQRDDDGGMYI